MASHALDLSKILTEILGYTLGEEMHIGRQPDQPNLSVILIDTNDHTSNDISKCEKYHEGRVQILVRGLNYIETQNRAVTINETLDGLSNFVSNESGFFIYAITNISGPMHIGYDDKNRIEFSLNYLVYTNGAEI